MKSSAMGLAVALELGSNAGFGASAVAHVAIDGVEGTVDAGVGLQVVDGALDGLAGGAVADVLDDEFR